MKTIMLYSIVLALALSSGNAAETVIYGKDTYACKDVGEDAVVSMTKMIYANDACDKKFDTTTAKMICAEALKDQGCKADGDVPTVVKAEAMKAVKTKCDAYMKDVKTIAALKLAKNGVCVAMGKFGGDDAPKPDLGTKMTTTCADTTGGAVVSMTMQIYKYGTKCVTKLDAKIATMACEMMKDDGVKCVEGVPTMVKAMAAVKDAKGVAVKCDAFKLGEVWKTAVAKDGCKDEKGEMMPFLAGKATCNNKDGKANVQVAIDFKKDDKCTEAIPKDAMADTQKNAAEMFKSLGGKMANTTTGVTITMDLKGKCADAGNATLIGTVNVGFKCISVDAATKLLPTVAAALKPLMPSSTGTTGGDKKPDDKKSSAALYAVGVAAIAAALF